MVVYFVGLLVLAAVLVVRATRVLHLRDHRVLPRRAAAAVAAADRSASSRRRSSINTAHRRVPGQTVERLDPVTVAIIVIQTVAIGFGTVLRRAARRAERGASARRVDAARGGARGERRAPAPAASTQAREAGVLDERAADGRARSTTRSPRADRHRHPARGGRAGAPTGRTTGDRHVDNASGSPARA